VSAAPGHDREEEWMTHDEADHGGGGGTAAGGAGATGAPECQVCPICMGLAALRQARPEAMEHLLKAGAELLLAARALLDTQPSTSRPAGLQRIDIG
jgi:hypothetical protein